METSEQLKQEIERVARDMSVAPSTIGRMVGQGGHFYKRLCEGKRVWPETADKVRVSLAQIASPSTPSAQEGNQ